MVKCTNCGKQISDESATYCDICREPLCKEWGIAGLCSSCFELWESEIDLEDMETEGE